jgi:hypothetical protein
VAGGYGASSAPGDSRWFLNAVYAPGSVTTAETFLWYRVSDRLKLGVAHLLEQNAFRALGTYRLVPERGQLPSINASVGVQGIGTGNPGYALTAEKNFGNFGPGNLNTYLGVGWRANEDHAHLLGGVKYSPDGRWTVGFQHEGHNGHPFVTYGQDSWVGGLYLIEGRSLGYMVGVRY